MIDTVLLDRDGVINFDSAFYIKSPEEWKPIPGSLEAVALIGRDGKKGRRKVGVVTNQRGMALGLYDADTLAAIHEKMRAALAGAGGRIDALAFCPHDTFEDCECRKPRPGMLLSLLEQFATNPDHALMVGDKYSDIEAARAAGVRPVLVLTGQGRETLHLRQRDLGDTPVYADLAAVALALQTGTLGALP